MSSSSRWPTLVIVGTVLLSACVAGRGSAGAGVAVAIVGLAATYFRRMSGIPVSIGTAAIAMYAPHVMATAITVGLVAIPIVLLAALAIKNPALASTRANRGGPL